MDSDIHKLIMKKAGDFLARRPYSRGDLQKKLAAYGDARQVEAVLQQLERLSLLNDMDYAYNFALRRIRQLGWSQARVKTVLQGHHVDDSVIQRALEQINKVSGGEASAIREYISKRYGKSGLPSDTRGIRKLMMYLRQRGFEQENIFRALSGQIPDDVLRSFETGEYFD